jgi:putative ABC transport system permease protein
MRFILQMARRELRASWGRLLFFFLCIAIGVGAIVALHSMIGNAAEAINAEARSLLTADVQVDTERQWNPDVLATIERVAAPLVEARVETIESPTMLRPADPAREGALMVDLKGIEPPYPFYGDFKLSNNQPFDYALIANRGAVVAPALLDRLGLRVGDEVKIGNSTFQIRASINQEPGIGGGFRLGPRVFVERAAVEKAGLTGFGSLARRKILFRAREGQTETLVKQLKAELKNSLVNVRSYRESQENLNEQLASAENYSSLTGLVILVLGGIGISSVTRVFIDQKKKTIAVLKCVGGTGGKITLVYLAQIIALGMAGSLLGITLGKVALYAISKYLADSLPPYMSYGLSARAIIQGLGVGVVISILFSALPLLRIRQIKPNMLLREDAGVERRAVDLLRWAAAVAVVFGLIFLVSWQAGSIRVGLFFLAGLGVTAGALHLAATLLIALVRRAKPVSSFALKQAINSLYRPGNQTRVIVMAVGLGVFLVVAIQSIQSNLTSEFDISLRARLPGMFLINIQKDQEEGVKKIVEEKAGETAVLVPTLRARIVAINGNEVDLDQTEMRRDRGRLGREYVVTYRPDIESNEQVVAGEFWDELPSTEAEVPVEESMKGLSGLDVGSAMTFDIAGRKITARVTSIRRVDWRNSRTGFMVLFRPGVLENAPQTLIAPINGPDDEAARSRFQRALSDQYPNISIIDVSDILRSVKRVLNTISLVISFIGGFVFVSGALILTGSIAMTKFQRVYEAAVLKTLGAKRKTLLVILLTEYGLIGLVAGLIGSAAAVALSYTTTRFLFDIPWSFTPEINFIAIAATVLLVVVVGALSTLDVLARKPLAILRGQ